MFSTQEVIGMLTVGVAIGVEEGTVGIAAYGL